MPEAKEEDSSQFDVSDLRTLDEVVSWLLDLGHIPSFCTACYREDVPETASCRSSSADR